MEIIFIDDPVKIEASNLIEEFQIGLYVIEKGRFNYVNSYFSHMLGYEDAAQLIGRSFWSFVHPDDVANVSFRSKDSKVKLKKRRQGGFRLLRKDGRYIWVRMKGKNRYYHGRLANIGHVEDLALIQKLEERLEKYRIIIDEVEDVVAETDLAGNLTFVNAAGVKRFSGVRYEVRCDEIESHLHKNGVNYSSYMDEKSNEIVRKAYRKIYETGNSNKNITYEIIKPDGSRITVEDSVSLTRDNDGKVIGFRAVSRDISSRVEAERKMTEHRVRLEAIFRSVSDAIITVDPDFQVIEANAATKRICGTDPQKLVGHKFPECIDCCSKSCANTLWKTLSQRKNTKEVIVECRHRDRLHQIITVNASPLLDSENRFMGGVLIFRDITQLKSLENELLLRHQFQNIVGKSKKMQEIYHLLEILSDVETTVLIAGKSGTGKELVARALHYGGRRALKPFITVNCGALAENLLESELFGHVKGAFTGAISNKKGRFHAADGGTIMLDEIGDISPMIQLKLLRVIQEKEFERVGEVKPFKVDVRIIACTNKDLLQRVKKGQFREDLYYRLRVMELNIPSLNERSEDIPLLVNHFCKLFSKQFNKKIMGASNEAMNSLMNYSWPGNVRELKHVIERAFVLCSGNIISQQHLPAEIVTQKRVDRRLYHHPKKNYAANREAIIYTLKRVKGNKSKAARLLGISRQTLYRRIDEYQIRTENGVMRDIP